MSIFSPDRSYTRRDALTLSSAGLVGALAGCVSEDNPAYDVPHPFAPAGGPGGGVVPGGDIPHAQDITRDQADVEVASADALRDNVANQDGRVIWIPDGTTIDLSGGDLYLENVVIASSRGGESAGGVITTSDQGSNSPVWDGGSNARGLIEMGDNSRLTGVVVHGPHYDANDHHTLRAYFGMPDGGRSARDAWRADRYARGISIRGHNVSIDNCEVAYFSVQCIAVGSSSGDPPENTVIAHSYLHNAAMDSLGYPVDVRTGHPQIHRCYFDAYRHAVNGSGYATAGYYVTECTFGPWKISFAVDMHGVFENTSGSSDPSAWNYENRAGGTMVVDSCRFLSHRIPDLPFIDRRAGQNSTHATIRAIPENGFWFVNNVCSHGGPDDAVAQRNIPSGYSTDENGYHNVYVSGNNWGVESEIGQQIP